ncbi:MAG: outer membrane beta-barrel protein [Sandaracinus sp.]|nr:outer membrane beta-barrel protein [Sandaracinus sp.]MCB9635799.1 outer membrane beta-barrel protein [Sandaracinus sp.]
MRNPMALLALVLVSALPSLASAQSLSAYFALGAGGELHVDTDDGPFGIDGDFEADLDPSLGAGVRLDVPVASIVSVGGLFEMGGYKVDDTDRDADLYFDFDLYAKIGPRFDVSGDLDLEVYGLLPFGFSIFRPDDDDSDNMFGINLGFGGGAALYMGRFAFFAEIGMRHRRVYDEVNDIDVRLSTTQAQFNFGATIVLGDTTSSRSRRPAATW